jgi:GNAT superfamily N-acetyltransferase
MTLEIKRFDNFMRTPVVAFAVEGWHYLAKRDLCDPIPLIAECHKAIVAYDPVRQVTGAPLGIITFNHYAPWRQLDIYIGYVHEAHRRRGIYSALFAGLIAWAQDLDCVQINGGTNFNNEAMRKVSASLGRKEHAISLIMPVPPKA